jgi:hypothetical protein
MPKTSEDTIMANSPSLAMGLLMFDNVNCNEFFHQPQQSPFIRSLSNVVAPFTFDDESARLFEYENSNMQYWPIKTMDDTFIKCQLEHELASIDALFSDY